MELEIKKYPNPVLRKRAEEVKEITPEIKKLIDDMKETMTKGDGAGLAAPQIGELKRIIVVDSEKGPLALINPEIIRKTEETEIAEEGCLSFPKLFLKIRRAKGVEVKAENEKGEEFQLKASSIFAWIFQHEIDHLDGVLFIDKISFWQKLKIKRQLQKFKPQ